TLAYERLKRGFAIADYYDEDICEVMSRQGFVEVALEVLTDRVRIGVERSARKAAERLNEAGGCGLTERMQHHLEACVAAGWLLAHDLLMYRLVRSSVPRARA